MESKLNLIYRLTVQTKDTSKAIVIQNPLTIDVEINRSIFSNVNQATFTIYNLHPTTRDLIFQDTYNPTVYKKVIFEAGYKDIGFTTIFIGNMFNAYSFRQDQRDIVTQIYALDGGLDANTTNINETLKEGTSIEEVNNTLINKFSHLKRGLMTKNDMPPSKRALVMSGNVYQLLKKYNREKEVWIDLEKVNITNANDVCVGYVPLITDTSGLLGTPRRRDTFLSVEMVFEPRIIVSQIIELNSKISPVFNGQYKVSGLKHRGTFSDGAPSKVTTTLELFLGAQIFGGFNEISSQ